jgi:heme-degrading monooxygenase HmoA
MLMKFKGLKSAKRFKAMQPAKDNPCYLAIYEFASAEDAQALQKSPEMAAVQAEMKQSWKEGGMGVKWAAPYEVLGEWRK